MAEISTTGTKSCSLNPKPVAEKSHPPLAPCPAGAYRKPIAHSVGERNAATMGSGSDSHVASPHNLDIYAALHNMAMRWVEVTLQRHRFSERNRHLSARSHRMRMIHKAEAKHANSSSLIGVKGRSKTSRSRDTSDCAHSAFQTSPA